MTQFTYVQDGPEIYRQSFARIRAGADLGGIPADLESVAVRMIHACGMLDLPGDLAWSPGVGKAARAALTGGAPVLVDSQMLAHGVTRRRLPAANPIVCTINDDGVADDARARATTRSAAAVDRWLPHLDGAVVAVGNAPTALFRLLEILLEGGPRPAAILGIPVGFVGVGGIEAALAAVGPDLGLDWLTVHGTRGGSAMAAAAINALATEEL